MPGNNDRQSAWTQSAAAMGFPPSDGLPPRTAHRQRAARRPVTAAAQSDRLAGAWLRGALVAIALFASGCASTPNWEKPPADFAPAPQADGALAQIEADFRATNGADMSGFRLIERNDRALTWRLALVDSARHTLDLQYYVWFGDTVGQLMMLRVIAAADRGVRVRLLFDDLNTLLHDMDSVELRDAMLARIDAHPNIEIRVFNAWRERSLVGRAAEGLADFERLNRRMHNKQMVADNRVAIIGGRNIGDEYFGLNPAFNFHDLDVLGFGPVAREASKVFDRYWNSEWVRRIPRDERMPAPQDTLSEAARIAAGHPALQGLLSGKRAWDDELAALSATLRPGKSAVHTDSPSRAASTRNHMPEAFRALMRSARREVLITNAYIIPDAAFMDDLRELAARGVAVRILTNSLASHDVPAVNSHYERWRRAILQSGARLYELRADAAMRSELVDVAPVRSEFAGLHTKAMVIDRERCFVGSMNLDPRSEIINSEMGVLIDSPPLAADLADRMARDMAPENSWQVTLAPDAALRWSSTAGERTSQPARHVLQRLENLLFKLFPAELY